MLQHFAEICHQSLTKEGREYWYSRGFTDETINKFKIGYCTGEAQVYHQMLKEKFLANELRESNLFYSDGREVFGFVTPKGNIAYFTLPNISKGKIIDIQGRIYPYPEIDISSFPKYKNLSGTKEEIFNPDVWSQEEIFICEGIVDAISLIQLGYPAVAIYGASGLKEQWLNNLKEPSRVYFVLDNDEAGFPKAKEYALKIGIKARLVQLPGYNDINEMLVDLGFAKAKKFMEEQVKAAKTALSLKIEEFPKDIEEVNETMLEDISIRLLDIPSLIRSKYITEIAVHFGVSKRVIEDTISKYKNNWELTNAFVNRKVYHPANQNMYHL